MNTTNKLITSQWASIQSPATGSLTPKEGANGESASSFIDTAETTAKRKAAKVRTHDRKRQKGMYIYGVAKVSVRLGSSDVGDTGRFGWH
jgi:hypothetical protein